MSASINDKLTAAENGGAPQPTTVSSARSIGGTTLSCVALTNWPTATAVHLVTYKKKADGSIDRTTLCLWKGIVSGTTVGTLTLRGGTDAGNSVGDFVEMGDTSAWGQDLYDGLTQTLNTDGTLKDSIVTTAKIAGGGVTSSKLDWASTGANGGIWWEELGRTTLGSAGDTLSVASLPPRKHLLVIANLLNSGAIEPTMRFNGDAGNNYAIRASGNGAADAISVSQSSMYIAYASASAPQDYLMTIKNIASAEKVTQIEIVSSATGAANAPNRKEQVGKWANTTDAISTITITNSAAGDFASGSEIIVLGHN